MCLTLKHVFFLLPHAAGMCLINTYQASFSCQALCQTPVIQGRAKQTLNLPSCHLQFTGVTDIDLVVAQAPQSFILETEWEVQHLACGESAQELLADVMVIQLQHTCVIINFVQSLWRKSTWNCEGIWRRTWPSLVDEGFPKEGKKGRWGGELSRQEEQHVQRPWGRGKHHVFKKVKASVMELLKQYNCNNFLFSVSPDTRHFSKSLSSPNDTFTVLRS